MGSDRAKLELIQRTRTGDYTQTVETPLSSPIDTASAVITETMNFVYNPDGTLASITVNDKVHTFVWNHNKTLSRIVTKTEQK